MLKTLQVLTNIATICCCYVHIFRSGNSAIQKNVNQPNGTLHRAKLANDDGTPCDRKAYLS